MNLQNYQKFVSEKLTEKRLLADQLCDQEQSLDFIKNDCEKLVKARWVLSEVSRLTQQKVSTHIESLVTMALQSVYGRPFYFLTEFDIKRNKSECQMSLYEGSLVSREEMLEKSFIPKDEEGGGILDIISFALRVVLWTIQNPKSRNVLILDEPGKFLGDLIEPFGKMLKEVAEKLMIQMIIITHDQRLKQFADKAWTVTHNNTHSMVIQDPV